MKDQDVTISLQAAVKESNDSALGICSLSLAVMSFLDKLSESASWWQRLGIGAARNAVADWRVKNCPPNVH